MISEGACERCRERKEGEKTEAQTNENADNDEKDREGVGDDREKGKDKGKGPARVVVVKKPGETGYFSSLDGAEEMYWEPSTETKIEMKIGDIEGFRERPYCAATCAARGK